MTTKTSKKTSQMDKLLTSNDNPSLPKMGEIVGGKVVYVGRNEIIVDIGGIVTGIIRGHEAYDESGEYENLRIGDEIAATVLELENERGLMELSIRQAGHQKAWDRLKQLKDEGEIVQVSVLDANKGGLMVKLDNIVGFLPVSQLSAENYPRVIGGNKNKILEKLKKLVGTNLDARVIDIKEEEGTLIVSEKEVDKEERKKELEQYNKGGVVEGVITGVVDFGAFIEFGDGLEGLVHISELGWQRIDDPKDVVKEGQQVKAQIIEIDKNKVSLSIKRLKKDPWRDVADKYKVGDKVKGMVVKKHKLGAFVEIEPNIQGLARFFDHKNKTIDEEKKERVELGDKYNFIITNFEPYDHKLGLSLADNKLAQDSSKQDKSTKPKEKAEPKDKVDADGSSDEDNKKKEV